MHSSDFDQNSYNSTGTQVTQVKLFCGKIITDTDVKLCPLCTVLDWTPTNVPFRIMYIA